MSWAKRFDDPIMLPGGRKLVTLSDARTYILKLPKAEHESEDWRNAIQSLLMVAEQNGPAMFARMAITKALNRNAPPLAFDPSRKDPSWQKRKPAREAR